MLRYLVRDLVSDYQQFQKGVERMIEHLGQASDIPLQERWDAYTVLIKNDMLVKVEPYGDGFIDTLGPNLTLYDDFNIDRNQTTSYVSMYEHIMEADGEYQQELVEARENNLEAWMERVLASGQSGFVYDW